MSSITLFRFIQLAVNNLRCSGQQVLVGLRRITFGIMAYGLIGELATGAGVLLVQALVTVLVFASNASPAVLIWTAQALIMVTLCMVGLQWLTVFGVTRTPTRVFPSILLNERL